MEYVEQPASCEKTTSRIIVKTRGKKKEQHTCNILQHMINSFFFSGSHRKNEKTTIVIWDPLQWSCQHTQNHNPWPIKKKVGVHSLNIFTMALWRSPQLVSTAKHVLYRRKCEKKVKQLKVQNIPCNLGDCQSIYIYIYIHENNGMVTDVNNMKQRIVAWSITTDIYRPSNHGSARGQRWGNRADMGGFLSEMYP